MQDDASPAFKAPITSEIALDHILHELRRALRSPIFRIRTGALGPLHDSALEQGWLAPAPPGPRSCADPRRWPNQGPGTIERLQLTDRGLKILAEDQCRNGLPTN
jgi:hypothetical protein